MLAPGASAYSIARPTGHCAATGVPIAIGERFMAVLIEVEGDEELKRVDFSLSAWESGARPPAGRIFAAWASTMVEPSAKKKPLLGDDELLDIFDQLAPASDRRQLVFRYLLALALIRRRMLRYEGAKGPVMLVKHRGVTEGPPIEVQDPGMDEAAINEAMEELSRIIPIDDAGQSRGASAGGSGA